VGRIVSPQPPLGVPVISLKEQLQEQLARATQKARDEGYQSGYAAALRDLQELSSSKIPEETKDQPVAQGRRSVPIDYKPSPPRGNNARLISDALQSIAPRSAGPTEIISIVKRETGTELAFSSTRHALDQLTMRGQIEQDGELKRWRHCPHNANVVGLKR
jgi:hypothetical protein